MVGDVVGKPGRRIVTETLPQLREEIGAEFVIANGENAAKGLGLTRETALPLFAAGVDVITLGNHTWAKKDAIAYFDEEQRILRPANYPSGTPGRGWGVFTTSSGAKIGVINLLGRIFMEPADCPFRTADQAIETIKDETGGAIIVDMHGEATSEKSAMGWYLNGRVSAVVGTHTHVQTSDERVLSRGTGYITDVGMVGPENSILGLDVDAVVTKFVTLIPTRFEVADGPAVLHAVKIDVNEATGACLDIKRIKMGETEAKLDALLRTRVKSGGEG